MMSTDYPIREIFRIFYPDYLALHPSLPPEQQSVAHNIMHCKTGEFGYNVSYCEDCGFPRIHSVSCNNRSCPCCQAPLERKWEKERNTELIPGIPYFHVVFTVPHDLNPLFASNKRLLLNLLFRAVQGTLLSLCADKRFLGARPGILSVLHTWGQTLSFHPHVHVCLSGGGLSPAGQFVQAPRKGFFLPKAAIASMFRGRFLLSLKKLYDAGNLDLSALQALSDPQEWKRFVDFLLHKPWIPFIKETFNGRGNAIKYLARYSFRTAIANSRITDISDTHVSFRYRDYADGGKEKIRTVKGTDFIALFLQHVLPKGVNRVLFSGYLTNCRKTQYLKRIHQLRNSVYPGNPYRTMTIAELFKDLYGKDICVCPECFGRLIHLPRGMPFSRLPSNLQQYLYSRG